MQREIAEQIIQAMKGVEQAIGRLDTAVWRIEDEEERRRMLRFIAGVVLDSHHHITLPVVHRFPDLHPDSPPEFRSNPEFKPGLPVRHIDAGTRLSEATIYDDRVYLSGMVPEDTSQDITGQTRQVLGGIDSLLKKAGSHRTRMLSALIFLADMNDFAAMNAVWDEWIVANASPARAAVQANLSDPRMKVEIMVVAAL
jgi:enamine deaminase RidA (YjgF/YER057c/UK114 family)